MRASIRLLPCCLLGLTSLASAQELSPAEPSPTLEAAEEAPTLEWSGRLFVGGSATRIDVAGDQFWSNQQTVNSARAGLRYKHPSGLRAVIKIEFADGDADLKDGYLRMDLSSAFRVTAGRFKKPISFIGLDSKWDLPSIERGLLDSVRVEGANLPFARARGDGLMINYRAPLKGKTGVSLALFQNDVATNIASRDASEDLTQDPYLRLYAEPIDGLHLASTLAVFAYQPETLNLESYAHAPVGTFEVHYKSRSLQVWAEGFAGESVFAPVQGRASGRFLAARGLVSPRFRVNQKLRVEPFVGASFFDPRTTDPDNSNTEVQGGVSLAFTKFLRLQFEVSHVFSEGVFSAVEKTDFFIQLASRFKE